MDTLWFIGIATVYAIIGMYVGKWHLQRKHGVYFQMSGTGPGFFVRFASTFLWPALLVIPSFRNPALCTCRDHVLERASSQREYEQYQDAVRRERGE